LVLIDGDGMIFNDDLIKKGEIGGKEAASMLWDAVKDYVQAELPDLPLDHKIMTRIYANLKGLGDVCHKAGILHQSSVLEEFARGLTGSKHLFDFVDVGMGKDRADDKISGKRARTSGSSLLLTEEQRYSSSILITATAVTLCLAARTTMDMLDF